MNADLAKDVRKAVLAFLKDAAKTGQSRFDHPNLIALPYQGGGPKAAVDALFVSILWDMVAKGIIVPGLSHHVAIIGNNEQKLWPFFTITPFGVAVLSGDAGTVSPHDSQRYMEEANARIPGADDAIAIYLQEAADAFESRLYLSSAVMLGVSAEALMGWLIKAMRRHLPSDALSRFDKGIQKGERATAAKFSVLLNEIDRHKSELSRELYARVEPNLSVVINLLKTYRDKVAHGRPLNVDAQIADGELRIYLGTLSLAHELATALASPCRIANGA